MPATTPPKAVVLRKHTVLFCLIGLLLLISLILYNLYHASHLQPKKLTVLPASVNRTATQADIEWIQSSTHSTKSASAIATHFTQTSALPPDDSVVSSNESAEMLMQTQLLQAKQLNEQKAMLAPINSNQLTINREMDSSPSHSGVDKTNLQSTLSERPVSPYLLQAGTLISGQLMTGIHSALPGQIIGQVRTNVYDSLSGRFILIPQGAKLLGYYNAQVSYGQERVFVVWKTLLFPNGQRLNLPEIPGSDASGYTGLHDQVNLHVGQQLMAALLTSTFSASADVNQARLLSDNSPPTIGQALSDKAEMQLAQAGTALTAKSFNAQPTLIIRPGTEFTLIVTQDIIFPGPYPFNSK